MKIMASSPITSWQIDGETMETVTDFLFLDSTITADGDCSHEIKKMLAPWKKSLINLDSVLKSRDITLPTKVCIVKAMIFPLVMYGCESWTIKKAEPRNWCFQIVVLEKTLESPLDCKIKSGNPKGNQYWVFIGSVHWFWSWSSKPLATLCDKLPHWKRPWCGERLKAGGEVDNRRWDGWMASLTRWMWVWASFGRWWWDKAAWHAEVHEVAKTQTWLRDWTKLSSMLEKRKIYTSAKITFWTRYLFDSFIKEM